jgi:hypothetical protein
MSSSIVSQWMPMPRFDRFPLLALSRCRGHQTGEPHERHGDRPPIIQHDAERIVRTGHVDDDGLSGFHESIIK